MDAALEDRRKLHICLDRVQATDGSFNGRRHIQDRWNVYCLHGRQVRAGASTGLIGYR